jgi:hypothetical protein
MFSLINCPSQSQGISLDFCLPAWEPDVYRLEKTKLIKKTALFSKFIFYRSFFQTLFKPLRALVRADNVNKFSDNPIIGIWKIGASGPINGYETCWFSSRPDAE